MITAIYETAFSDIWNLGIKSLSLEVGSLIWIQIQTHEKKEAPI